ncbi:vWA domain-containing protein [Nocardia miyunensis]|uniref:vWA domain-containing protein n=1 Tax=Nocardia miyunensis TaxID=282684 RepID=UPI00083330AB|nr:VWA domain-containing protein [Nocardia miyunensis]
MSTPQPQPQPHSTVGQLAGRAARWLGLGHPAPQHRHAVAGDRLDEQVWTQTFDEAPALPVLENQISDGHTHPGDLLHDLFLAAYKAQPRIRDAEDMLVSRLPNHAVVSSIARTPEFQALHRHTVGDRYAAAMAVLAHADALKSWSDDSDQAQSAADDADQHARRAQDATDAVTAAFDDATAGRDLSDPVPDQQADTVDRAIADASAAAQDAADAAADAQHAAAEVGAALRANLRAAADKAVQDAAAEQALMTAWGIPDEQLERMSFRERTALAQRLRSGRLGEFADLIGRFRVMAAGISARRSSHGRDEVIGVTLGADLSRLIPSELAAIGVPALRAVFAAKYAEQQLAMYQTVGPKPENRGAIIACIDCSPSMRQRHPGPGGREVTREAWAKACGLALLDQARRQHRDFVAIMFAATDDVSVYRFPATDEPLLDQVLAFADHPTGHGTDFRAPLEQAADILAGQYNHDGAAKGDIVLITDGEDHLADAWLSRWRDRKARLGFRTFAIAIDTTPTDTLTTLADHLTLVDELVPAAADDLFTAL